MGAALGPIAMWVVAGLLVAGGAYFVYRKLIGGAVAKDDLKEAAEAEEERQDATQEIKSRTARLRDALRRAR